MKSETSRSIACLLLATIVIFVAWRIPYWIPASSAPQPGPYHPPDYIGYYDRHGGFHKDWSWEGVAAKVWRNQDGRYSIERFKPRFVESIVRELK